jgi:hypothetical protein
MPNPPNKKITLEDEKNIIKWYSEDNKSAKEILALLKNKFKTTKTIYDILRKYTIKTKEKWEYSNHDHFYFSNIDTPNKAYILGLILSDGWIINKTNQIGIQLQEEDIEIIEKIKTEWKTENKILYLQKKPFKGENGNIYYPKPMCRICINSPRMIEDLNKLGIVHRKSKIATLPLISKKLDGHLFRGIIDGDGSIYWHSNKNNLCIRILGSHYLVAQSCLYLTERLKLPYHRPFLRGNISTVDYSTIEEVQTLLNFIYKDIDRSFCIERKYNVAKNYFK